MASLHLEHKRKYGWIAGVSEQFSILSDVPYILLISFSRGVEVVTSFTDTCS